MFDISQLPLFVAASWVLILTPGPDMIYVTTRGAAQGKAAGLASALGVTLGILIHTVMAAVGLTVILQTSAYAFLAVKFVGATYLIYLGVRAILDRTSFELSISDKRRSNRRIFAQGVLSNVLNPKVALFFLAFLPQFVNPQMGSVTLQMVSLGLLFALFGVMFLTFLGYSAGRIGQWLTGHPGVIGKVRWATGAVLVGLGLRLALSEHE